ncbi:unnamed protein product [Linum tenue]|uniref:Pentatricopeptide repeat-containing protein n=1 Tax=Linum tenue TaxID=586396 RepID=A0AAV0P6C8_9ROSI|nr:unnamed protein product [Linum tenue]
MARASASIATFLRQFRGETQTQARRLTVECSESESSSDGSSAGNKNLNFRRDSGNPGLTVECKESESSSNDSAGNENLNFRRDSGNPDLGEIAKEVSNLIRTKPRWEQTLRSDFPSFNFADSQFFQELLKHQTNAFLLFKFFHWLRSELDFIPNQDCCNALLNSLLDANAVKAANFLLELPGFAPDFDSLQQYIHCLCENGLIHEAIDVLTKLRATGKLSPSIKTWNSVLQCCLKLGKTDLLWKMYQDMMETGVVADIDTDTVFCLIDAFAKGGEAGKGYELLKQLLKDGLPLQNAPFIKLISAFAKRGENDVVSELLHTMIARTMRPDVHTYQEVINGLCKNGMPLEALKVFNNLKDRGYAVDRVMYTTMIHGLCISKHVSYAKELWLEMIRKGIVPNHYTYNALIHGYFKSGNVEGAKELYKEMSDRRNCGETTVAYNTMITGLSMNGKNDEALELFKSMPEKGMVRDLISFNTLILGLCKEGRTVESRKLIEELLALGLHPSASTYSPVIQKLCLSGDVQEGIILWNEMQNKGLQPSAWTYHHFIAGLCKEKGYETEAMEWLFVMLKNNLKPKQSIFERVVQCLLQNDRVDDSLLVLNYMVKVGYSLRGIVINHFLWCKLPKNNPLFVKQNNS